jgi:hypothetical protein
MTAKKMGTRRALNMTQALRRLMSPAKSRLVETFAYGVIVNTCKFVGCVRFSEWLFCKL